MRHGMDSKNKNFFNMSLDAGMIMCLFCHINIGDLMNPHRNCYHIKSCIWIFKIIKTHGCEPPKWSSTSKWQIRYNMNVTTIHWDFNIQTMDLCIWWRLMFIQLFQDRSVMKPQWHANVAFWVEVSCMYYRKSGPLSSYILGVLH